MRQEAAFNRNEAGAPPVSVACICLRTRLLFAPTKMNEKPWPIGVLMPVLNARELVRAHLNSMRDWIDRVHEVVVVDSFSEDGTLELVQAELRHPRLRILQHPRGLYQSWNFGIQQLTAPYAYISTAGDTITASGLGHLLEAAGQLDCDVLLSPPEVVNEAGGESKGSWPIHKLLQACRLSRPEKLESWQVYLLATLDAPQGILGSSASNLYRTEVLRRFPFPTDYGHAGDTAWAIIHAFEVSFGISPTVCSRFVLHENETHHLKHEYFLGLIERMVEAGCEAERVALLAAQPPRGAEWLPEICNLQREMGRLRRSQLAYDSARRELWPWFVNPEAWRARRRRNEQRARVLGLRHQMSRLARSMMAQPSAIGNLPEYFTQRLSGL